MILPYKGKNVDILVLNKSEAENYKPILPTAVISITAPENELARFVFTDRFLGILRLQFHDINEPSDKYRLMSKEDAKRVVDFMYQFEQEAQMFLIHCEAGLSRSAGVAAALSWLLNGDDNYFYSYAFRPNAFCRRKVIELAIESKECLEGNGR